MSEELESILARHRLVMQRSAELTAQINMMKKRQGYVQAALQEGRRIADEIGKSAEHRIYMVMSNTHNQIGPQQTEIARLEREISELRRELSNHLPGSTASIEAIRSTPGSSVSTPPQPGDNGGAARAADCDLESPPVSPLGKICVLELRPGRGENDDIKTLVEDPITELVNNAPGPISQLASYSWETETMIDALINEEIKTGGQGSSFIRPISVAAQPKDAAVTPNEGSWTYQQSPRPDVRVEDMDADNAAEPAEADLKSLLQREHARREAPEPQPTEDLEAAAGPNTYTLPMSVLNSERVIDQMYSEPHPPTPRENIEQRDHSSIMYLDAFLDTRHFHFVDPWNKQVHGHRWQVKVQVEAPEGPAQEIGYSSVLAAVTATLMRYDKVLLNEVFPFDHIDPSHENIAGYFFNCLEDTVAIKGLSLVEVSLWEKQTLVLQVHERNEDIDILLRGEDILKQMRDSLFHEDSGNSETSFRKMLGMMFKNWD